MDYSKPNQLSSLVSGRLPEFVRVDHPTLVAFLSAYYEWLQRTERGGQIVSPMVLQDVTDIDQSIGDFITHFKKEYLHDFPEQLATTSTGTPLDVKKLIKNIKSFYRAKGTEKSYEFLFRILFDVGVEFYYPKRDILRTSDGKWFQKTSLLISNTIGNDIFNSIGNLVYQRDSNGKIIASAKVLDVSVYQQGQYEIAELTISGKNGTFLSGIIGLEFRSGENIYREQKVYNVLGSITVNNGGSGYSVGDEVLITSAPGDSGQGAKGSVSSVTSSGSIRKIKIDNFGINYESTPSVKVFSLGGSGFSGTANISTVCSADGYYLNFDGRISTNKVLQDNHYYQEYSYVLKAEIVLDQYKETIRRLIHPAGTAMFGQVLIKRCSRGDLKNATTLIRYEVPLIGHYLPYTFNTHDNLYDWFQVPGTAGDEIGTNVKAGYSRSIHDAKIRTTLDYSNVTDVNSIYYNLAYSTAGNPISNTQLFVSATEANPPVGLTGFSGADPFWIIYEHPNRRIRDAVLARIEKSQLTVSAPHISSPVGYRNWLQFQYWNEWISSTGGSPPQGWTADFYDETNPVDSKLAFLRYSGNTQFFKITARSFFNVPIGDEFDCRTESATAYATPVINITSPLNSSSVVGTISGGKKLTVNWTIANYENLIRFGVDGLSKIRVRLSGVLAANNPDGGVVQLVNLNSTTTQFSNVGNGNFNISVDIVNGSGKVIQGIGDRIVCAYSAPPGS
jgi:hypothetical protein